MNTRIAIFLKRKIKNMSSIDLFFHNVKVYTGMLFQETNLMLSKFNITKNQIKPSRISKKKKCINNKTVDTA